MTLFEKAMAFTKPTETEIGNLFNHHPPIGDQAQRYADVRQTLREAAIRCVALTPSSPRQTRAVNKLHEAMMLFNSAIACDEGRIGTGE